MDIEKLIADVERLKAENAALLAANKDCIENFNALLAEREALRKQEPAGYANGDELANMLNDRSALLWPCRDNWRTVPLYAAPVPPVPPADNAAPDGWRQGVAAVAEMIQKKADDYAQRFGHDDVGGLSFGHGSHAEVRMDHYTGLLELADEVRAMLAAAPKPECHHQHAILQQTGDGTPVEFCPDCGRNEIVGSAPKPEGE